MTTGSGKFHIVMLGHFGRFYFTARRTWMFEAQDARQFDTHEEAEAEFAAAKVNGKREHFRRASIEAAA